MKSVVAVVGILAAARSAAAGETLQLLGQQLVAIDGPAPGRPDIYEKRCETVAFTNLFTFPAVVSGAGQIALPVDFSKLQELSGGGERDLAAVRSWLEAVRLPVQPFIVAGSSGQCEQACTKSETCKVFIHLEEPLQGAGGCTLIEEFNFQTTRFGVVVDPVGTKPNTFGDCRHWTTEAPTSAPTPPPTPPPTDSDSDSDGSRVPTSSMLLGLAGSLTATALTIAVD